MKLLIWNCRGANNANFTKNMCILMECHNITILALTKTRMEDHNKILHAPDFINVVAGYSGRIALFWRNSKITIQPFVLTEQGIHNTILVSTSFPKGYISIIYSKNTTIHRKILWDNLRNTTTQIKTPWLFCEDFNEITSASDKLEGIPIKNSKRSNFISCLGDMYMTDLGFTGQKHT